MAYTIKFDRTDYNKNDQYVTHIRNCARAEGYTTVAGFQDWAKEAFDATIRRSKDNWEWTSISFKTQQDMTKFILGFKSR